MLKFASRVVENMYIAEEGVHIALVVYGSEATVEFTLGDYTNKIDIMDAIDSIDYNEASETRTDLALEMIRETVFGFGNGNRLSVRDIAIVVTDGFSANRDSTRAQALSALNAGIRMFSIGVANAIDRFFQEELNTIGSDPDSDHVFQVTDFSNLKSIEDTLVRRTCREAPPGEYIEN